MIEISVSEVELRLISDLVRAFRINTEGNLAAIEDDPALALVAEEGIDQLTRQLEIADSLLGEIDRTERIAAADIIPSDD